MDYSAPKISSVSFKRTSETTAEASFSSDTDGILYWKVLDKSEIPQDTSPKKPETIINGGNIKKIQGQTTNVLELENLTDETQYFCFVSEDEYGNRMEFYDYEKIPTYVAPEPPVQPEESLIESITVSRDGYYLGKDGHQLTVTTKEPINMSNYNTSIHGKGIVIQGYQNLGVSSNDGGNVYTVDIARYLTPGDYTLKVNIDGKIIEAPFTVIE